MRLFLLILAVSVFSLDAFAQETLPDDPCSAGQTNYVRYVGGIETNGVAHVIRCNGSVWQRYMTWKDGSVGIGSGGGSPGGMMHISSPFSGSDRDPEMVLENIGSTGTFRRVSINFHHSNGKGAEIEAYRESGNSDGMDLRFFTQSIGGSLQQRMVITNDGLVGIAKADPSVALDVVGDIHYTGIISDVSDRREKEDIRIIGRPLERIGKLHGVSFSMKDSGGKRELGLIAQDVAPVFPELVVTLPNGTMALNYQGMTGPLVEAVKELHAQNVALAADNAELRRMLHALSARMDVLEGKARPPLRPYNQ